MAKYLTKHFINLSDRGFSPYGSSELRLYHVYCGFYVASFVIMLKKFFAFKLEVVVHISPYLNASGIRYCVTLEWYIWVPSIFINQF